MKKKEIILVDILRIKKGLEKYEEFSELKKNMLMN